MQNIYEAILVVILIAHPIKPRHCAGSGRVVNARVHSLLQLLSLHQFRACFSRLRQ